MALVGLSLVLLAHEMGHFLGARFGGMRVRQLALGFGWRLFGIRGRETDYRINAFPFGGYVMVDGYADGEDGTNRRDPRLMQNRPAWARALYAAAGPIFNFLVALLIIVVMTTVQGIPSGILVSVRAVQDASPAQSAGLQQGDVIVAVNGREIRSSTDVGARVRESQGPVELAVKRGEAELLLVVSPRDGRIGITVGEKAVYSKDRATPSAVLTHTFRTFGQMSTAVLSAFAALLTGRARLNQLSGPVGMVTEVAATAAGGWASFMTMLALISINLGLFNLIPFPALDGGRLLLIGIEKAFGVKLGQKHQAVFHLIGFAALFLLMILVSVQDVVRIIH